MIKRGMMSSKLQSSYNHGCCNVLVWGKIPDHNADAKIREMSTSEETRPGRAVHARSFQNVKTLPVGRANAAGHNVDVLAQGQGSPRAGSKSSEGFGLQTADSGRATRGGENKFYIWVGVAARSALFRSAGGVLGENRCHWLTSIPKPLHTTSYVACDPNSNVKFVLSTSCCSAGVGRLKTEFFARFWTSPRWALSLCQDTPLIRRHPWSISKDYNRQLTAGLERSRFLQVGQVTIYHCTDDQQQPQHWL